MQSKRPFNLNLLLIHGAWHGAWIWDKVIECFNKLNQNQNKIKINIIPIDLNQEASLEKYIIIIKNKINLLPGNIILVGHSMAGAIISAVASSNEQYINKIKALVYLTAYIVNNGESIADCNLNNNQKNKSAWDKLIKWSKDKKYSNLRSSQIAKMLYNTCERQDIEFAKSKLGIQVTLPLITKVKLANQEYFSKIPKYYIECTQDKAIFLFEQRAMQKKLDFCRIFSLDCCHSAFFSDPGGLSECLLEISNLCLNK